MSSFIPLTRVSIARRFVVAMASMFAVVLGSVAISACGGDSSANGGYRVRAIFGNAFAVVNGQEVRVAGARIGTVEKVDVTPDRKAAVVFKVDDPAFRNFTSDAHCEIRPQNLIGERFLECEVSGAKEAGETTSKQLVAEQVDGQKQFLLPEANTSNPVDIDLVVNTLKLPERQRLQLLINELGVGLAGRGGDLRKAIRNSIPALRQTDRVLTILASQNGELKQLAERSDKAIEPFATNRKALTKLIRSAGEVQSSLSQKGGQLDAAIKKFPVALNELKPTLAAVDQLTQGATPTLRDLRVAAPATASLLAATSDFATEARQPTVELGEGIGKFRGTLLASTRAVDTIKSLGKATVPVAKDANGFTDLFKQSGGFKRQLDFVYDGALAFNGFDERGHYFRQNLMLGPCSLYVFWPVDGCDNGRTKARQNGVLRATQRGLTQSQVLSQGFSGESAEQTLIRRVLAGESAASVLKDVQGDSKYTGLLRRIEDVNTKGGVR